MATREHFQFLVVQMVTMLLCLPYIYTPLGVYLAAYLSTRLGICFLRRSQLLITRLFPLLSPASALYVTCSTIWTLPLNILVVPAGDSLWVLVHSITTCVAVVPRKGGWKEHYPRSNKFGRKKDTPTSGASSIPILNQYWALIPSLLLQTLPFKTIQSCWLLQLW